MKDHQVKKAEVLQRMKASKNDSFTPAELALVENSDDDEGEVEIQRLISDHTASGSAVGANSAASDAELRSHVNLPSQKEIDDMLLLEKRKALLAKLGTL